MHTYIHTLRYLPSDFRVAYSAANISEHLTIRWEIDHHTRNYVPYSCRSVCELIMKGFKTVYCPHARRIESLTICRCHYKGSTFFSIIWRLSVGTRDLLHVSPVLYHWTNLSAAKSIWDEEYIGRNEFSFLGAIAKELIWLKLFKHV